MVDDGHGDDGLGQERPRKRYKLYGEPNNESMSVNKTTAWRFRKLQAATSGQPEPSASSSSSHELEDTGSDGGDNHAEASENLGNDVWLQEADQADTSAEGGLCGAVSDENEDDSPVIHSTIDIDQMSKEQDKSSIDSDAQGNDSSAHSSSSDSSEVLGEFVGSKSVQSNTLSFHRQREKQVLGIPHLPQDQISGHAVSEDDCSEESDETDADEPDINDHPIYENYEDLVGESSDTDSGEEVEEDQNNFPDDNRGNLSPAPSAHQQPPPPPSSHEYLKTKLKGIYSERITDPVAATRGEILLNIQEFCRQHPIPLTAQEDLHRLVNSLFYKEVIPASTFKLDKLYASGIKKRKFFYCSQCFKNFGELDHKSVKTHVCPECGTDNIIHDLTKANYFIILDFVHQIQLLLEDTKVASELKNPNQFPDNGDIIRDLHDGEMYRRFVASLDFEKCKYYMSFTACTDGTPLFKSSTLSIWPIFVMINELPPHLRMSNIILGGLWFGKTHPKMDLFLEPFCDYIRVLSVVGFHLTVCNDVRLYRAYLIAVCADSGARGSIQCVHLHNGQYSCNWCLHPGEAEGDGSNARKFLQLAEEPAERTSEQMIRDGRAVVLLPGDNNSINGVTGISPLLRCPKFHIVHGMILDNLHWASFGVARRLGTLWLGETKKKKKQNAATQQEKSQMPPYYIGTDETKSVINKRISKIRPPREVRRLPRHLSQSSVFSAREWENLILYFSVPLFKNLLPECFLKHWTLFVQAFYLFMKSEVKKTEIEVGGDFMKEYLNKVLELYGRKEHTFNNHISNHAKDNTIRWGAGWSISSFAFENGNKILKSKINAERGIAQQVSRSLDRDSALSVLRSAASTPQTSSYRSKLVRKEVKKSFFAGHVRCIMPKTFSPSEEERWLCERDDLDVDGFAECNRIIVQHVCYGRDTGARTDNSYAYCAPGRIMKIRKIIANEVSGEVYLFVSRVRCNPYPLPRGVTNVQFSPFMYTVNLIEQGVALLKSSELVTICVNIEINDAFCKDQFLSIMPNTMNVF